jgi:hypothetical protein
MPYAQPVAVVAQGQSTSLVRTGSVVRICAAAPFQAKNIARTSLYGFRTLSSVFTYNFALCSAHQCGIVLNRYRLNVLILLRKLLGRLPQQTLNLSLTKGKVESSILSGSTSFLMEINYLEVGRFCAPSCSYMKYTEQNRNCTPKRAKCVQACFRSVLGRESLTGILS